MKKAVVLVLHDVRSSHNVGSAFRTADGAGVTKIYLTGYTPAPVDRFGREVSEIAKTALGAEKTLVWEKKEISECLTKLKEEGFQVIALEQHLNSVDYKSVKPKYPVTFVFGNEVDGLNQDILKMCDVIAEIPMKGGKESLNVSVAFGIGVYRIAGH